MEVRLDVVIPAFNEQDRIGPTIVAYRRSFADPGTRFLVALDGCSDATADVVRELRRQDGRIGLLEFPKLGKGGVILETFRRADADVVAFVDADGATPPAELRRLVEVVSRPGIDGAIASRRHPASVLPRRRNLRRRLTSTAFVALVHALFRLPYRDTQCGAKVLRREAVERIVPYVSARDLVFDVDLLLVARSLGLRVVETPTVWIDQADSRVDAVADSGRMAAALVRLWLQHRFSPVPGSWEPRRRRQEREKQGQAPESVSTRPAPLLHA